MNKTLRVLSFLSILPSVDFLRVTFDDDDLGPSDSWVSVWYATAAGA